MFNCVEIVCGYVQVMYLVWLQEMVGCQSSLWCDILFIFIEICYCYNLDVKSLLVIVLVVILLLLMMILVMFSVLSVVCEKEFGLIINLYVMLIICSEFLFGKQLFYIVLGMFNFFLLCVLLVFVFGVVYKGSFLMLILVVLLYVIIVIGLGLLILIFMKS